MKKTTLAVLLFATIAAAVIPVTGGSEALARPGSMSSVDIRLLAQFVEAEGRGEAYITHAAIAAVVLNRLQDERFPKSVGAIIFFPGEFAAISSGGIWEAGNSPNGIFAQKAVSAAIDGFDPTGGALHYFRVDRYTPSEAYTPVKQIGNYIFCK